MVKKIVGLAFLLISTAAIADFCPCPSNFNLIQIGDTLDKIKQICCKPTGSPPPYQKPIPVPQIWTYYVASSPNPANTVQNTIVLTIKFDKTERVTNITSGPQSLTTTNCGTTSTVSYTASSPNTIKIGDTMKTVEAACGSDKFVQEQTQSPNTQTIPTIITELQYAGPPPVTLRFTNGILTEIVKGIVDSSPTPAPAKTELIQ